MIALWITLGYFAVVFISTKWMASSQINERFRALRKPIMENSKDKYVSSSGTYYSKEYYGCCRSKTDYGHSYGCIVRWSRSGIVMAAFGVSLLWPVAIPLYIIFRAPTSEERAQQLREEDKRLQLESERIKREYNL